jgi:soluble lytic murein transglycosylase-like protein
MQERSTPSGTKSPSIIAIGAVVAIILLLVMGAVGPNSWLMKKWNETPGQQTSQQAPASGDYRSQARQDAINAGIDPDLYERQINQESGFNPSAQSPMGAEGIAQIMPDTGHSWGVDPWNASDALRVAAQHMAWYQGHYGSYEKGLAAYNAGSSKLDYCISNYTDWKSCLPGETQRYIAAIMGA